MTQPDVQSGYAPVNGLQMYYEIRRRGRAASAGDPRRLRQHGVVRRRVGAGAGRDAHR